MLDRLCPQLRGPSSCPISSREIGSPIRSDARDGMGTHGGEWIFSLEGELFGLDNPIAPLKSQSAEVSDSPPG